MRNLSTNWNVNDHVLWVNIIHGHVCTQVIITMDWWQSGKNPSTLTSAAFGFASFYQLDLSLSLTQMVYYNIKEVNNNNNNYIIML